MIRLKSLIFLIQKERKHFRNDIIMKNRWLKVIITFILGILILIMFMQIFKGTSLKEIIHNILSVDKRFIFVGIFIMFLFSMGEALNIRTVLVSLGYKIPFITYFKYALLGFFFSSITPSSSGGQPMQVYSMTKDKIKISHSFIALIVELFSFQIACFLWAIVGFILSGPRLIQEIGQLKYLFFIGFLINFLILFLLFILLFSRNIALKIINFCHKLLKLFKYRKSEAFYEKALKQLDEYNDSALFLKTHKVILYKTIGVSLIKMFLYHSIPYFVYRAFGFSEASIFAFVSAQAFLYCAVSFLPFPGSLGVSESGFVLLFKLFFPEAILNSAMLISRGISLYLYVCITGILLLGFIIARRISMKKVGNI